MVAESDGIEEDLERICSSPEFAASPRLVRFLRFCVEQSRLNHLDNLKESTIGIAVFDREPGYDVKADPIVRVTAARLRRKLEEFYRSRGDHGTVIEIPKGSYVAFFHIEESPHLADQEPPPLEAGPGIVLLPSEPPILIRSRRILVWAALAALLVALVALGVWLRFGPFGRSFSVAAIEPLVALPGLATDPAWSPDGETLAFAWNGGTPQPPRIYLLKRGASVPNRLTLSDQAEYRPVWSPDGRKVALMRQTSPEEFSLVIAAAQGPENRAREQVIRRIAQPASAINMTALDWSPDGKWLVSSEGSNGGGSRHLVLISPIDRSAHAITDPPLRLPATWRRDFRLIARRLPSGVEARARCSYFLLAATAIGSRCN